jgi:hypothetical protein
MYAAGAGVLVYLWMRGQQANAGPSGLGTLNLPTFSPCVIDPTTGDCVSQESPMPGTPLSGVPNVNPAQQPGGGFSPDQWLADPQSGGGGSIPVTSGAPGSVGTALQLTP